jgi:rhodanese-related sulfurtransferase
VEQYHKEKNMKKNIHILLSMLVLLSMLLAACGGAATPEPAQVDTQPEVEEPAEVVEVAEEPEVVEEPTEEPAVEEAGEPDLDGAFSNMLANMSAYNTIKADGLLEQMVSDTPPFLLDVRTTAEVEEAGHIEGAVNIPLNELAQNLDLLPSFDTPIVTYCGSGWRATIAMTTLSALGWSDVKALKVTFDEWKEAGNPVGEGAAMEAMALDAATPDPALVMAMDAMLATYGVKPFGVIAAEDLNVALGENANLQVIDVRTAGEVEENGNIDAANLTFVPLEDFINGKESWPSADSSVVVYCGSGHRSTIAMTILGAYGYNDVKSLKGGYGGWADAGFPTVGGTVQETSEAPAFEANFTNMLAGMEGYNTVKADGLMAELIEDTPPFLLDVRSVAELEENGYIEGATNIPLNELAQHTDLLPSFDTPIVTYCGSGWRATIAMTTLYGLGWEDVRALKTSFADWVAAGNPVADGVPEPMALNVVTIDENLLGAADSALSIYGNAPYAGVSADDLNLQLAENPDLIVMDVRTDQELVDNGVIDTGELELTHVALENFIADKAMWPVALDAPIAVYCGSGHRSTMATTILGFYGYTNVTSLKGGFGGWVTAEYPVVEYAAP